MPESISILPALIKLGGFQYCANHGNIGDLLIDIATRQFFRRHHLPAQEKPHRHVVYGGGGRFVSFYGSLDEQKEELTARSVERCIILPHSFYQVDSLLTKPPGTMTVGAMAGLCAILRRSCAR